MLKERKYQKERMSNGKQQNNACQIISVNRTNVGRMFVELTFVKGMFVERTFSNACLLKERLSNACLSKNLCV